VFTHAVVVAVGSQQQAALQYVGNAAPDAIRRVRIVDTGVNSTRHARTGRPMSAR
jgi:hypothetical protein